MGKRKLVLAHFDSHGVSFAAGYKAVEEMKGNEVVVISKFPETGPRGLSDGSIKNLVEGQADEIIVIDIPIDVRNPDASINTLAELAKIAPVHYFDHHDTDRPFLDKLKEKGIDAKLFEHNVAMAEALGLFKTEKTTELAIVGMVADRDKAVLSIVPRTTIETKYLPLANKLDMIVRNPRLVGGQTAGDVANILADKGVKFLEELKVDYPPEKLADELLDKITSENEKAILLDWSDMPANLSMWIPKTLEQLLVKTKKSLAIAVVPAFNPRTKEIEGYDVRALKYWLSDEEIVPENVVKELFPDKRYVGHADYVSVRFDNLDDAKIAAEKILEKIVQENKSSISI